jgi:hypothetical protein
VSPPTSSSFFMDSDEVNNKETHAHISMPVKPSFSTVLLARDPTHNGIKIEFKSHRAANLFSPHIPCERWQGGAIMNKLGNKTSKCVNGPYFFASQLMFLIFEPVGATWGHFTMAILHPSLPSPFPNKSRIYLHSTALRCRASAGSAT